MAAELDFLSARHIVLQNPYRLSIKMLQLVSLARIPLVKLTFTTNNNTASQLARLNVAAVVHTRICIA